MQPGAGVLSTVTCPSNVHVDFLSTTRATPEASGDVNTKALALQEQCMYIPCTCAFCCALTEKLSSMKLLLRTCLLLLLANSVTAARQSVAICNLHLQGNGGIKTVTASLHCRGSSSVTAVVHQEVLSAVGSNSSGVTLISTAAAAGCDASSCLLCICNGTAIF